MSFVYRLAGGQGSQEHMEQLHNEGVREGGRRRARVNNRLAAAGKRVWVSTAALGLRFSQWGTSGSPLGEDGQNVASNSRPGVTAREGGGGATAGADLSPAAAGQRGKLYRHLSAQ